MFLEINAISKSFDKKQIFDQASYQFETGKIYGILGRNGAGKTTLFQCIARNMTVDSGSIYLVEDDNQRTYENTDVGFTFTQPHLPGFMTAIEFLRFFMDVNRGAHQTVAFSRRIFNVCRNFFRRAASFNERLFPWHEKQSTNAFL